MVPQPFRCLVELGNVQHCPQLELQSTSLHARALLYDHIDAPAPRPAAGADANLYLADTSTMTLILDVGKLVGNIESVIGEQACRRTPAVDKPKDPSRRRALAAGVPVGRFFASR